MIFDFSDGDFIFPMNDKMGMDMNGDLHLRMGDNFSLNLDDGDIHFTSPWDKNDGLFSNNDDRDDNELWG